MNRATLVSPDVFLQHAMQLRARKLKQIANTFHGELRIHAIPTPEITSPDRSSRANITSVLRNFRGRLR